MGQHILTTSAALGEVSPLVSNNQDNELYRKSLAGLKNWFVLKTGGMRRRSGTRYRGVAKYPDRTTRLIPYTYIIGQSYALEFGDEYMRVWHLSGQVLNVGGTAPYELVMPYDQTHVNALQIAPYNDIVNIAHSSYHPRVLRRNAVNDWSISNVAFVDGPYLPINDVKANTVTVTTSPADGVSSTLTWSSGSVSLSAGVDIGRHVRVQLGSNWSWGKITAVASALVCTVSWVDGNGGASGASTTAWRLGAFYVGNYPASVSFYENRAAWSGVPASPRTVFFSMSELPANFSPSTAAGIVTDQHAVTVELSRSDPILWLSEGSKLLLGTARGIRTINGSNGALSPTSLSQRLEVRVGANSVVPEQVGNNTVFPGRLGRTLHKAHYDYQVEALVAPDMSVYSEHLLKRKVVATAYQETPDSILWSIDTDGKLYSVTMEDVFGVNGFATHPMSGTVQSICTVEGADRDELWLIARRTIDGAQVQYVETLERPFDSDLVTPANAFLVDCGVTYSGAAVNTITGLEHLEGETVELLADAARLPNVVVTDGEITLPNSRTASTVQLGLPIANSITTLEAPALSEDGSSMGRRKKAYSVTVKCLDMQGLAVGVPGKPKDLFVHRNAAALLGVALPLNTGNYKMGVDDSWENAAQIEMSVVGPFPATILALNVDVESEP